jgi:hypothetical protein
MLSQTKYEKITKEARQLIPSLSGGQIDVPRVITLLKEITGEVKTKKIDHRAILQKKLK